ncbi:MAG: Gfo/Idh/MocA family oxidoreductase [Acidobacteria bacterium]|nr:Gfo/Idh/MocA family oxidoreductase [Acidobacteriota bacterium]
MPILRRDFLGGALAQTVSSKPVRIGFIGTGSRGTGLLRTTLAAGAAQGGVEIPAVCDINEAHLKRAQDLVEKSGRARPEGYSQGPEDYLRLVAREDLDAVINAGPWELHTPMSVATMKAGKYAATEVPAAVTLEQCWELVNVSESTGMPCMFLENVCYFRNVLAILAMIRKGLLGDLSHCEGGYQHDVRGALIWRDAARGTPGELSWRGLHYERSNGNLYPTHPAGPIGWWLDINRGDRFTQLVSMSSLSQGLNYYASTRFGADHRNAARTYASGDVNTSLIRTERGRTVTLYFDTISPRPYDLILRVQGTKGIYSGTLDKIYLEGVSPKKDDWEPAEAYFQQYEHPLWKRLAPVAKQHGHGGADFMELYEFIRAVKSRGPVPIDVYDGAAWSAIFPLSIESVAKGSQPVEFPDFTRGKYRTRKPVEA